MSVDPAPDQPALLDEPGDDTVDDLAAELDEPIPTLDDIAVGDEVDDPEALLYQGTCRGGPYNGRPMHSRFPKGFLLVDRPRNRFWRYDYHTDGSFACDGTAAALSTVDRVAIADGDEYDVIAYDGDDEAAPS